MLMAGLLTLPNVLPNGRPVRDSRRVVYEIDGDEVMLAKFRALNAADQTLVRDLIERLAGIEPRIIGERPEE